MGSEFLIRIDQQSIRHLLSQPLIADRHIKWASFIQSFHPLIQYQPGYKNEFADALSHMHSINNIFVVSTETFASMINTYAHDNDFSNIYNQFYGNSYFLHENQLILSYHQKARKGTSI